jgi:hypothetical protein
MQKSDNFYGFNINRAVFVDYKILENVDKNEKTKILKEAGWTENDYEMLRAWFFMDTALYNNSKFNYIIAKSASKKFFTLKGISEKIQHSSNVIKKEILPDIDYELILILIMILFFIEKGKIIHVILFLSIAFLMLLLVLIVFDKHGATQYPLFFMCGTLPLFYISDNSIVKNIKGAGNSSKTKRFIHFFILLTGLAVLAGLINKKVGIIKQKFELKGYLFLNKDGNLKKFVQDMNESGGDMYVFWGDCIPYEHVILPFSDVSILKELKVKIFPLILFQRCELVGNYLMKKYGVKNIYLDIINREHTYLVCSRVEKELYMQFMREHYNVELEAKRIDGKIIRSPYCGRKKDCNLLTYYTTYQIVRKP